MYYKRIIFRLFGSVITILGVCTIVFFLVRVVPGDPVRFALGPDATEEMVEKYRHELGFDQPLMIQFVNFLYNLPRGKLGLSLMTNRDALQDIVNFFPATLELTTVAMGIGFLGGTMLGVFCSRYRDKWPDQILRVFAIGGVATPRFMAGIVLQLVLGYWIGIFPCTGRIETSIAPPISITGLFIIDSFLTLNFPALVSSIRSIILPAITLSLTPLAQIARLVRGSMVEEGEKDYVLQSKANGLPANLIRYKYMLRNAITPALTSISVSYGWTLGYAFVVESVFAWPGICFYGTTAALSKDLNVVVAVALMIVLVYTIINLIVDMSYLYLDPRIRYGRE